MGLKKTIIDINLRGKFFCIFAILMIFACGIQFLYSRHSMKAIQTEFELRGVILAQAIAAQSPYAMIMGDNNGLKENIRAIIATGETNAGAFFDKKGSLLAEINLDQLKKLPDNFLHNNTTLLWTELNNHTPILVSTRKIYNNATNEELGYILVSVPANSIQTRKATDRLLTIFMFVAFIIFGFALGAITDSAVVKPVYKLREAAGQVAAGNFEVSVDVDRRDEIGELAHSFNTMVINSKNFLAELKVRQQEAEEAQKIAEKMQQQAVEQQHYMQQQFEKISDVITAITVGDLTKTLQIDHLDDIGVLMQKINQMILDLRSLIGEVRTASRSVAVASHHISTSAEEMSSSANEQDSQTKEVATAIEEMSKTTLESSQNATKAANEAKNAADIASDGEKVFHETLDNMLKIANVVKKSADTVKQLGDSSSQIGEIVQVINDIADQTNLLALNAAIEAARAGEQGRGFAVVADEVRKLAERTTSATKEIADMIKKIQQETEQVVVSMTKGNEQVESGMKLADRAADSLTEIISGVNKIVGMIDQIATGSQEQSAVSEQISNNVEAISKASTEVSKTTNDLAMTADSLDKLTEHLRHSIERFRVGVETKEEVLVGV